MLEVRGLSAGYGPTQIIRGLDLDVAPGKIVAVLGANGVGKTTLNKTLSGLLPIQAGDIRFEGQPLGGDAADILERGLVHVPEGRKIFPNMTVRENLELGSYRRAKVRRAANLEKMFVQFPRLRERSTQRAGTLSGGEQQMLAIGRGLMAEPRLLILDEPSLGLSPLLVEEMFALIRRLNAEGQAILLVEQNVVQSLEVADTAYIIENGSCSLSGPASELAGNPAVLSAYLGLEIGDA